MAKISQNGFEGEGSFMAHSNDVLGLKYEPAYLYKGPKGTCEKFSNASFMN